MTREVIPSKRDGQGVHFVDRDPKYFQLLLNFLRDGWCRLPSNQDEIQELLNEVRFYQLGNLDTWIRSQLVVMAGAKGRSSVAGVPSQLTTSTSPIIATSSAHLVPGAAGNLYSSTAFSPGRPTVAYTGSPVASRRSLFFTAAANTSDASFSPGAAAAAGPGGVVGGSSSWTSNNNSTSVKDMFLSATAAGPAPQPRSAYSIPLIPPTAAVASGSVITSSPSSSLTNQSPPARVQSQIQASTAQNKWTHKYLTTNNELREVVNTLMELAFLPLHTSLHAGKVTLTTTTECFHDQPSTLLAGAIPQLTMSSTTSTAGPSSVRQLAVNVCSTSGWYFKLDLRASQCDTSLINKYNVAEFVQDNWFVLSAVLKDQFNVLMEELPGHKSDCPTCRKIHLAVQIVKIC
ncbi:hypothetical protein CEUSTIGMA_g1808.t1 [Chlamydomonas eustigma]|uniref:Potassium channel tetramerisation-type BTB domain-containing protein n=1 Tax=Chlamydomonas eustigma TaxID=1157962 RepID=A0A250WUG8_9CHLO|nr:hypothetical protein CEUSTIGMA_g1808.t1 [Chlamydomonas eustigma]|eukprot:GAX74359.1 hypothetical protein CEUSTIGMA_g1808.t1 [Chlamydomonas eustigma]